MICIPFFKSTQLIDYYVREKYTLRYTGGMVPDVNQVCLSKYEYFLFIKSNFRVAATNLGSNIM